MSVSCQFRPHAPQQTASLFDHHVGAGEQRRWHVNSERLGSRTPPAMKPIRLGRPLCCARAASGHATAQLPSSVMNSRRFIANSAPDALNLSVSNFSAQVQAIRMSEMGQTRKSALVAAMSAFPPIATKLRTSREVRFVPTTDISGWKK